MMIQEANRDIKRLHAEDQRRRCRREQLDRIVHQIDDLLFHLEELNLQGQTHVPMSLRKRASDILDSIPHREEHEALRIRQRVVPMMDVLFRAQEALFRLRDPQRPHVDEEEELS